MKRLLLINGPNLNLLGTREPEIYGQMTLPELEREIIERARSLGMEIRPFQSNHEGALIDFIQQHCREAEGIIINPGALTHYSYSLRDCLASTGLPVVEVHISNLHRREEWRRQSVMTEICIGSISGLGIKGYFLALEYFRE